MKIFAVLYLSATLVQITLTKKPPVDKHLHGAGEKLIVTPYIEANKLQEGRKAAEVHLEDFQNVTSYSGFFTVDKKSNGNLFFWFFPSASNYAKDPVMLWLQGGPGFSGIFSVFLENGPFGVENGRVVLRNLSWHKNYSLLYIDQPVGTGFSFTKGKYVTDETQVAEHLYSALIQFFTLFPELQKREFFISGESYAGKYIPAIGYAIHQKNPTASLKINLKGLLIGNGYIDPINQMKFGDLLYQIGLIDFNTLKVYHETENEVRSLIKKGLYHNATDKASPLIGDLFVNNTGLYTIFNLLKDNDNDRSTEWEKFIIEDRVRRAIHVGNQSFTLSSDAVGNALYADVTKSVAPWFSELLSHYRTLLYNGQLDLNVPYIFTENFLQILNFSAAAEYKTARRKIWHFNNLVAGYVKTAGNLTEVLVRNAGHLVIMDKPAVAYDLVTKFTNKQDIAENIVENEPCNEGETSFDGCNTCVCEGGAWTCTLKLCLPEEGDECTPNDRKQEDCNTCICTETGVWGCTKKACIEN